MLGGLRKWSVAMSALVMGFVLAVLGKLTADFATIAAVTVGAFQAAHAVQDWHNGKAP